MSANMNKEPLIRVQDLGKSFGSIHVLKGINVNIYKGDVVFVVGPSGSGKSTFLRCLNLLEEPTQGHIFFEGTDITDPKVNIDKHRQKMGMVFQQFNLFPHMDIMKNLTLAPMKLQGKSQQEAETEAMQLLERVGLADRAHAFPSQLSGGQKQRIAIARAICLNPSILILDDATSAVDMQTEHSIQLALKEVMKNRTTFIVAHRISSLKHADEILVFNKGRIRERGTHHELLEKGGYYKKIYDLQYRDVKMINEPHEVG